MQTQQGSNGGEISLVAFDADDTLWRCQDYFDEAQLEFERIVAEYADIAHSRNLVDQLLSIQLKNLELFGYGVKGMALSMIEAAIELTNRRVTGHDIHRIVELAKRMLRQPVELLPGVYDAVGQIAAEHQVVLITKGDLFHQESKVRQSGLAQYFHRIEIVSEKDEATYTQLLDQLGISAQNMLMVGNSLRSDILPVLNLGGWAVFMPYHTTWPHEASGEIPRNHPKLRIVDSPEELPDAIRYLMKLSSPLACQN